jgi:hypothetical protein
MRHSKRKLGTHAMTRVADGVRRTALCFVIGLVCFAANRAEARWEAPCGVAYEVRGDFGSTGWSRFYDQQCTFMTGMELNTATTSFRYDVFGTYVAFWWGQGQVTIVKADALEATDWDGDSAFTASDAQICFSFRGIVHGRQAVAEGGTRRWRISVRRDFAGGWASF